MVKSTFLFILGLFCSFATAYGQEKDSPHHSLRVGLNGAFFGAGDIYGTGVYAEYSHAINKYLAVTPRIMSAYANRSEEGSFDHASSFSTSLALSVTPLPNAFGGLRLDVGGLYHRFINAYGATPRVVYGGHAGSAIYSEEHLFGLIGSLSINFFSRRRIESGLRLDMLTSFTEGYFNCDSLQSGLYFGVKF